MDETYLRPGGEKKRFGPFIVIILVIIVVAALIFFLTRGNKKIVSPIPPKASFEVIFYTPTPFAVSPTSTPSATPKVRKAPTATPAAKATPKITLTPTIKSSPSPTVKPT